MGVDVALEFCFGRRFWEEAFAQGEGEFGEYAERDDVGEGLGDEFFRAGAQESAEDGAKDLALVVLEFSYDEVVGALLAHEFVAEDLVDAAGWPAVEAAANAGGDVAAELVFRSGGLRVSQGVCRFGDFEGVANGFLEKGFLGAEVVVYGGDIDVGLFADASDGGGGVAVVCEDLEGCGEDFAFGRFLIHRAGRRVGSKNDFK